MAEGCSRRGAKAYLWEKGCAAICWRVRGTDSTTLSGWRGPDRASAVTAVAAGPGRGRGREGLYSARFWKGRNKPATFPDDTFSIPNNPEGATEKPLELMSKFTVVVRAVDEVSDPS